LQTIGLAGEIGFGVGATEDKDLLKGWTKLEGHNNPEHKNYGNVLDNNGSVMVWIPKFYFKWTKKNKCKISSVEQDGYVLHRAFIDGGAEQIGFFIDKYECGNENGMFTSEEDLEPCSTYGNSSISHLNNNPNSNLGGLYKAAKTRGNKHFLTTLFIWNALGMLTYANNGNKLEQMKFHNNQKCGVKNIDPSRYEVAAGLAKLNDEDGIFKVFKLNSAAAELESDTEAYNKDFYDDLDLTKFIGDGGWKYTSDKTTAFKMSDDIYSKDYLKTCMGIPRTKALSDDSNERFSKAGVYRYARNELACIVGGYWSFSSYAGVFAMYLNSYRTSSYYYVGGRASVYL
jgi:hypothetical protein